VQWPCDFKNDQGKRITIPESWSSDERIEVVRRFFDTAEYERTMLNCDCLVLPYRWSDYFNRISGVVVEAATAGIPMVVVENTWLDRAIRQYGAGLSCRDRDPKDLALKIAEACSKIETLTDEAQSRAREAHEHHSSVRLLRLLWGL
jgi:glycosyltransferase involved in cell wall biosynthesis